MIYLILAIVTSALVSLSIRASENYIKNKYGMLLVNYGVCALFSYFYMEKGMNYFVQAGSGFMIILGVLSGILYLLTLLIMQYSTSKNGVVLSSTFMKLGVLIPTLMAILVFHEIPKMTQIIGILMAVAAIVLIQFEKKALSEGNQKIWLLILMFSGGITDSLANIYEQGANPALRDGYLLITFGVAAILSLVLAFSKGRKLSKADVLFGILLGITNYFSAKFLLLALANMKAVLVYPTNSVGTLVTISLVGVLVFKEKIDRKKAVGIGMIVLALALLNI